MRDYQERAEVDGVEVIHDCMYEPEERGALNSLFVGQFDVEEVAAVEEMPDPESWFEDTILFHLGERRGYVLAEGQWEERTAVTDFFRGIQESFNPQIVVGK